MPDASLCLGKLHKQYVNAHWEAEISKLAGSVCGPHELLDLCAMGPAAQENRGTGKGSDATCTHEQGQNNLLTN